MVWSLWKIQEVLSTPNGFCPKMLIYNNPILTPTSKEVKWWR